MIVKFLLSLALIGTFAHATTASEKCAANLEAAADNLRQQMRAGLTDEQHRPRLLLDLPFETPDPDKPLPITLPNGEARYLVGMSGQQALVLKSLDQLRVAGTAPPAPVRVTLFNRQGFAYGAEDLPYAIGSSVWDLAFAWYRDGQGQRHYKIYAGVMADEADGRPATIHQNYSRQRMSFDLGFEPDGHGGYAIVGRHPTPMFGFQDPVFPHWVLHDEHGRIVFAHGYGGGPTRLENGEPYIGPEGFPEMDHEMVVEEREETDAEGVVHVLPQRTVIVRTFLDPTLSFAVRPSTIVLDVFDPNGNPYPATRRTNGGLLVEGSQTQVRIEDRPAMTMAEIREARARGARIRKMTTFSPGDYFLRYGAGLAESESETGAYRAVEDGRGDLYNFLTPFTGLFQGPGRAVFYVDDRGQEMVAFHAATGAVAGQLPTLDAPQTDPAFLAFRRGMLTAAVNVSRRQGSLRVTIKDSTRWSAGLRRFNRRRSLLDDR